MAVLDSDFTAASLVDRLRSELPDLAYDLERQGRLDAADIVMQIDARLRELAGSDETLAAAGVTDTGSSNSPAANCRPVSTRPAVADSISIKPLLSP